MIKVGVALSGCDIGGVAAYDALSALEKADLRIGMVSACGMPSVSALLFACGYSHGGYIKKAGTFMENAKHMDISSAVKAFSKDIPHRANPVPLPLAISAVDLPDGKTITYTNAFSAKAENLITFPLADISAALGATVSLFEEAPGRRRAESRLCDYAVWYGSPVYPLKAMGAEKIVSISFLPQAPKTPYEVMVKQILSANVPGADIHIPIDMPPGITDIAGYSEVVSQKMKSNINRIYWKVLF